LNVRALPLLVVLLASGCRDPERIVRAPEDAAIPLPKPPPAPAPDLQFAEMHCTYGGTAPAFFVWLETKANTRITELRATKFEIETKKGFVSGASGDILVRVREKPKGEGNVKTLTTPIEKGASIHLEVFGGLAFTAFGPGVTYPSDDRVVRVELVAKEGMWTLSTTCIVGPAG